jgi:hypothetical protein
MTPSRRITRREFVQETAGGTAAVALGLPLLAGGEEDLSRRTARVVLIRDQGVLDAEGRVVAPVLERMLVEGVTALFGIDDPDACWRSILRPDDVLGIKSNHYRTLRTPPELEAAIKARALKVGIGEEDISIRDQRLLQDPVFRRATALVNARPLRAHDWAGIGGCLKNYITFDTPSDWHEDSCADLGGLWKLPVCAGRTRLNILVVLTPLFHSIGPHRYAPDAVWQYKGLLLSTDPVAVDALGVRLLEEMRKAFYDVPPRGGTSTKHVGLAETRHGIGVADLDRIELVRLGWMEEVLI